MPVNASAEGGEDNWKVHGFRWDPNNGPAFFKCPNCTHVESSLCRQLQHKDLNTKLQCNKCKSKNKVALWKCNCENFWHRCTLHRESVEPQEVIATRLKTRKQNAVEASSRKRANNRPGPDSHEWLHAEDMAREGRKRKFVDDWDPTPLSHLVFPLSSELTEHS